MEWFSDNLLERSQKSMFVNCSFAVFSFICLLDVIIEKLYASKTFLKMAGGGMHIPRHRRSQERGLGGPASPPPFQGSHLKKLLNYGISLKNIFSLSMIKLPEMRREVNNLCNDQFNYNFRAKTWVVVRIMRCVSNLPYCIAIALNWLPPILQTTESNIWSTAVTFFLLNLKEALCPWKVCHQPIYRAYCSLAHVMSCTFAEK